MSLRLAPYFLRQAAGNIMNNRGVHAVGSGTMAASLLIFGAFLLLFVNLNVWLQGWEHALSMSVYLKDGISEQQKEEIAKFIKDIPGAEIKQYISKETALNDLRKALGPEAGLLEGISRNPLPASFEVAFEGPQEKRSLPVEIKAGLEKMNGVAEVHYSEEWLRRFEALMKVVRLVGVIIGSLLSMGVLFIVTNTIKLTIYSRREEIEILKLVGATDWFVKIPFLLEGLIQGVLSGLVAIGILFLAYLVLSARKMYFLSLPMLSFTFIPSEYLILILVMSVFLALLGSFIAVGRFFDI